MDLLDRINLKKNMPKLAFTILAGGAAVCAANAALRKREVKKLRAKALYNEDEALTIHKSHQNPQIIDLYKNFLGEPNSHLAHELLHTTYAKQEEFDLSSKYDS